MAKAERPKKASTKKRKKATKKRAAKKITERAIRELEAEILERRLRSFRTGVYGVPYDDYRREHPYVVEQPIGVRLRPGGRVTIDASIPKRRALQIIIRPTGRIEVKSGRPKGKARKPSTEARKGKKKAGKKKRRKG